MKIFYNVCRLLLVKFLLLTPLLSLIEVYGALNEVACEHVIELQYGDMGRHKTCRMNNKTSLDGDRAKISNNDDSVTFLYFADNKKIKFLPREPYKAFQRLIIYSATNCSIKSVSYENFSFLKELKYLYLGKNEIERINSDTFHDLESLERLSLSIISTIALKNI